jgi:hypothetical protein
MLINLLLVVVFVAGALFAWRGWSNLPALARSAGVISLVAGLIMLVEKPSLLIAGAAAVGVLAWTILRPKRKAE